MATHVKKIQKKINYTFQSPHFLEQALIHSSALNEIHTFQDHNERLEFLGDAVLELCISQELYNRFPDIREGELTSLRSKMVNQEVLATLAKKLELDQFLILGKGEEAQGGRKRSSLLSDSLEAVIGAVFLDGGYEKACVVVLHIFHDFWPSKNIKARQKDAKTLLQELSQALFKGRPTYSILTSEGPEHGKVFFVSLLLPDGTRHKGSGSSIKRAEQNAAAKALDVLQSVEKTL